MDVEQIFDIEQYRPKQWSRRRLLTAGAAGLGALVTTPANAAVSALMCPPKVGVFGGGGSGFGEDDLLGDEIDYSEAVPDDGPGVRRLKIYRPRYNEWFDRPYVENGQYVTEALAEFSYLARDSKTGKHMPYDPKNIDNIWTVWKKLDTSSHFSMTSGYRSPEHNATLKGAATGSYHMKGKAADLVLQGRSVSQVYAAARSLNAGGVGKYTSDGFVHIDSGPIRTWGS
jgi:uncharacterized protein YcbK (DUF882 family)